MLDNDCDDESFMTGGTKNESFMNYMFVLSQKDKMELMNIFQYILLAIIPIVLVVKLMKNYLSIFEVLMWYLKL